MATSTTQELLVAAESIKNAMLANATGGGGDELHYQRDRKFLLAAPASVKAKVPRFVQTCRNLGEFWAFIQPKLRSYAERRAYLRDEFAPLLSMLEAGAISPGAEAPEELLTRLDWNEVQAAWRKALERKTEDPNGALTAARTLLETVCKHILDEAGVPYDPREELPKLYGLTANTMNMAPSQHTEKIFKQVLGSCQSVVEGLGSLRSKVGDAHGQGKMAVKPAPRHAELAVNLAGSVATFLAQTWEFRKGKA